MNFVTLIQYTFYDENTLNYMKHTLHWIDSLKTVFVKYKFQNTVRDENDENGTHFNILKLHVRIYYMIFIRLYDSAQSFDTTYKETIHKFLLKIFFVMTNRPNDWKIQIVKHNVRRHNMIFMQDVIHYLKIKARFKVKKQFNVKILKTCRDSMKLINSLNALNRAALYQLKRSQKHYQRAKKLVTTFQFDCLKFINALTIFIRKWFKTIDNESTIVENEQYKRDIDSNWVTNYFIDVHRFITCWKREGKNFTNLSFMNEEKVCCVSHWCGKNKWWKDCVWKQKINSDDDYKTTDSVKNNDRRVKQLKFMIIVFNHERIKTDKRSRKYIKTFIERLNWIVDERSNIIHDMFEARVSSKNKSKKFRKLDHRRFYDLCNIIRNVHLLLTNQSCTRFFINNFIDWNQYNTIFDSEFIRNGIRYVDEWSERSRSRKWQ